MKSTNPLRYVLVLVPALAALAVPATTSADTILSDMTVQKNVALVESNPCLPDEVLALTGTIRERFVLSMDNSGGFHVDDYYNAHGSGPAFSAYDLFMLNPIASYVASDDAIQSTNLPGPTFEYDTIFYTRVIRQAETVAADDLYMKTHMHFTMNANGIPTAVFDQPTLVCR